MGNSYLKSKKWKKVGKIVIVNNNFQNFDSSSYTFSVQYSSTSVPGEINNLSVTCPIPKLIRSMSHPLSFKTLKWTIDQPKLTATDHPNFWSCKCHYFPSFNLLSIKLDFFPQIKKFNIIKTSRNGSFDTTDSRVASCRPNHVS